VANLSEADIRRLTFAYPLFRGSGIAQFIRRIHDRVAEIHLPICGPGRADGPPPQLPGIDAAGPLVYFVFDGAAGNQSAYRLVRIPLNFVSLAEIYVHWTKTDDVDRSGESVKWVVTYSVFNGNNENAAEGQAVSFEDTYEDTGTTSRIVHKINRVSLTNVSKGDYVAFKIEKGTPGGTPMDAPGLVSLDFTLRGWMNRQV
jgi:hypothetical protein